MWSNFNTGIPIGHESQVLVYSAMYSVCVYKGKTFWTHKPIPTWHILLCLWSILYGF